MIIKAKWINSVSYPNMTNGNDYLVWGAINGGCQTIDDNGAVFAAPGLENTSFWQLVSIETVGQVQIFP